MKTVKQIREAFDERFMLDLMRKAFNAPAGSSDQKRLISQLNAYRVKYGMDPVPMGEGVSRAQQAAIAIAKKKSGKYDKDGNKLKEDQPYDYGTDASVKHIKKNTPGQKEDKFEPHWMYKDGKKKRAEKPEDHERLAKLGWTHEPIDEAADAALKKKADKSGISLGTLKKVYNRGMAAWRTGHRPGTTPQQWAMARVNSYITKGKGTYHGADKDLREDLEERVLTVQQRRARGRQMKRLAKRIAKKRAIKMKKIAGVDQLKKRANKAAKQLLRKKVAGAQGAKYAELSPQQKMVIDKMVEKKAGAIPKIAMKLLPKIKKAEKERVKKMRLRQAEK
jgi:hypothetical protein